MRRLSVFLFSAIAIGCGAEEPVRPLNSAAFYKRPAIDPGAGVGTPPQPVGPVDESGRVDPILRPQGDDPSVTGISDVVSEAVRPSRPIAGIDQPAPLPATMPGSTQPVAEVLPAPETPTTLPTGQYMSVGGWVAEVDGQPIFANDVMDLIQVELAAQAKTLDEGAYKQFATEAIRMARRQLIRDELVYRAAVRSLNDEERKLARTLTTRWMTDAIARAGGSEEQLRKRVRAEGLDFDKWLDDRHKRYMTQVYFQRKVIPLIVITADAMRESYEKNRDTLFSEKSGVEFRMIKISTKEVGDRQRAESRAHEVQDAAASGKDFKELARDYNREPYLRKNEGLPLEGLIERGAFGVKEVEAAAWALEPGQVSPVITVGDVFYIVKLERKTIGKVKPFNDEKVQEDIHKILYSEQFSALRAKHEDRLEREAIIRPAPRSPEEAKANALLLDIAMQRYKQWRKA